MKGLKTKELTQREMKKLETPGSGLKTAQVSFQHLHISENVHKREKSYVMTRIGSFHTYHVMFVIFVALFVIVVDIVIHRVTDNAMVMVMVYWSRKTITVVSL